MEPSSAFRPNLARGPLRSCAQTVLLLLATSLASAQNSNGPAFLTRMAGHLTVSWPGLGTLQTAPDPGGVWQDVLEATSPHPVVPTQAQQFFRVVSLWSRRAPLPEANSELAAAELDGRIYLLGGYPSSRITQRTVQVYDAVSNRWSLTTPLPIALNHSMAAAVNRKVYLIGGQTDTASAFTNTVFEFDPATTNWTTRAPMPTARSAGAAAVIGNRIYVAGGRPPRGQDFAVYDTGNNTWQTLPNLPTARNHLAACAIDGKVLVVGGRLGAGFTSAMTNVLEVFDPGTGQWQSRAPMPTVRGGINGIAVNGRFFVFGGEGPTRVFDEMEMYVPALDRWYALERLPIAVHGVTGAAFLDGWIHLPGGGTSTGGSSGSTVHQVFWMGGLLP